MGRLLEQQLIYLYQIIKARFWGWLGLMLVAVIILSFQLRGNPNLSGYGLLFNGTDPQQLQLPVWWFVFFVIPTLIVLDAFKQLWHRRTQHLRGLQFKPSDFLHVNVLLLGCLALVYSGLIFLALGAASSCFQLTSINFGSWSGQEALWGCWASSYLGILILLFLQVTLENLNGALALAIPLSWLVITAYSALKFNPLNKLMLVRISAGQEWLALGQLLVTTIFFIVLYYLAENLKNKIN
ncbi:hypothetical protein HU830_06285 [Lactobacillus sp. DCY120]|uniref:Uncharacterized protein n=1 Tax=Bombilactobacillus apium TaxID=2675299 RepID=A0A850R7U3_9LACO|nr:hypothetical protein [Bombilactobacillus apium]NVY96762.1 hypothetical protein [Bombilactobacillus apium]